MGKEVAESTIAHLEKTYGKGTIMSMSNFAYHDINVTSTGSLSLNRALGIGGLPGGRIVEIFGNESAGKTTLLLSIIREAQKEDPKARCLIIDMEHAINRTWAKTIGIDESRTDIAQPQTAEEALDIAESVIRAGLYKVVGLDSVAALVPKVEDEGGIEDQQMGLQARLMSKAMRKLNGPVSNSETIMIFINQLRSKIGVMFGNPETTAGGNALKYYASFRIELKKASDISEGTNKTGVLIRAKVVKNKLASPFKVCEMPLMFNCGISYIDEIIDEGLRIGCITKSGSYLSSGSEQIGQGRAKARKYLQEHPDLLKAIEQQIEISEKEENNET